MKWGDGLQANPGALQAKAAQILDAHAGLQRSIEATAGTDVGSWRGDAARAERSRHRKLLDAMERQAAALPKAADALQDAAATFTSLQATQRDTLAYAARWEFRISDWGVPRSTASGLNLDPRRPFIRADLARISATVTIRLNAADLQLAGRLGVLAIQTGLRGLVDGAKNALIDAGEWAGDKIMDGLEWSAGKIRDAYEWGRDKVQDVIDWANRGFDAAKPAWERLKDTWNNPPQWLKDWREKGEVPQIAEVLGSVAYLAGQTAGVGINFVTGEDQHVFDDGKPWVGDVRPHQQANYNGVSSVMDTAMDMYNTHDPNNPRDRASVQVTAVVGPDGATRYVVAIPGTTEGMGDKWGWAGSESGTDWAANLKGVGYGQTSAGQAAMAAVDRAIAQHMAEHNLTGKPQIMLTGHSQGGIIAANMAADPAFASRYDIKGIVSAGSPQQTIPVPNSVPVYNFANQYDPVTHIDFNGRNIDLSVNHQPNVTNINFEHSGSYSPMHTHGQPYYMENIRALESGQGSPQNLAHYQQMNRDLGNFFNGQATAYRVEFGREVRP